MGKWTECSILVTIEKCASQVVMAVGWGEQRKAVRRPGLPSVFQSSV